MADAPQPLSNPQQLPDLGKYVDEIFIGSMRNQGKGSDEWLLQILGQLVAQARTGQAAEIERLTPYVEAYRREERRADDLEEKLDEAVTALRAVWFDLKQIADSGDSGNWRAENHEAGKLAIACLAKHDGGGQ